MYLEWLPATRRFCETLSSIISHSTMSVPGLRLDYTKLLSCGGDFSDRQPVREPLLLTWSFTSRGQNQNMYLSRQHDDSPKGRMENLGEHNPGKRVGSFIQVQAYRLPSAATSSAVRSRLAEMLGFA